MFALLVGVMHQWLPWQRPSPWWCRETRSTWRRMGITPQMPSSLTVTRMPHGVFLAGMLRWVITVIIITISSPHIHHTVSWQVCWGKLSLSSSSPSVHHTYATQCLLGRYAEVSHYCHHHHHQFDVMISADELWLQHGHLWVLNTALFLAGIFALLLCYSGTWEERPRSGETATLLKAASADFRVVIDEGFHCNMLPIVQLVFVVC